eukprot:SAG31_NODE_1425_length_8386_cov_6.678201_3_plen_599_part_00
MKQPFQPHNTRLLMLADSHSSGLQHGQSGASEGQYSFLSHVDSSQLLGLTIGQGNMPKPSVFQSAKTMNREKYIFDCWAIEPVNFQWSGMPIDSPESQPVTMKHAGSDMFLACDEDGKLDVDEDYSLEKCHWVLLPVDRVNISSDSIRTGAAFYIVSKACGRVLSVATGGKVKTVENGSHSEHDCFVARDAPTRGSYTLNLVKDMIAQYKTFENVLRSFNDIHAPEMEAVANDAICMHANMAQWSQLRSIVPVAALESVLSVAVAPLLSALERFFLSLFPGCDHYETVRQLFDYDGKTDDIFADIAGSAGIVKTIFDCLQLHLFKTPRVLFGAPSCFFGTDIFLAIRASIRLCGIICTGSERSASQFLTRLDWLTEQIGVGQFKVAEALSSLLSHWPKLVNTIPEEFASKVWSLVKNAADRNDGNGDHCELLSVFCMPQGEPVTRNQYVLKNAVAAEFEKMIRRYLAKESLSVLSTVNDISLLQPTDERYFVSKLIALLTAICDGNDENRKHCSEILSHSQIIEYAFSDRLHPLIRSEFVKLAIVVIVDASRTGYPLPKSVRVEPYIRAQVLNRDSNDSRRVPAISKLKKKCVLCSNS